MIILNLTENEAKQEFFKCGIPVPKGVIVTDSKQTLLSVSNLNPPYMVKAQVPVGGRGKAGGIIAAKSVDEAEEAVAKLLGTQIKNLPVRQVLIEEKLSIIKELYLGITVDRFNRGYVALASAVGGVEIEEVAEKTPKSIIRTMVDPQLGIRSFHSLSIAKQLGYSGRQLVELSVIIQKLFRACVESDSEMVEINPLVETETGSFVAADARMVIDDNALFRHPEYEAKEAQTLSPEEALALKNNLAYVKLDGDIGVVGNGAGLVMATLDLLNLFGGKPANFLDLGGGATVESIKAALEIVMADPATKSIIVNVLGGITRCDEVAIGIIEAAKDAKAKKPLAVRLVGTNQKLGQRILTDAGIKVSSSMEEAARQAVEFAAGEKH
ncbi:MAG TPA: ADP-forming succinate--CoA ligase subunit beta [Candidatus Limnocylindrales bacterium]|nr:ADP-forming succinate--CoA ligase subunit beta [Candidatus Limnocylindrales bacterium]